MKNILKKSLSLLLVVTLLFSLSISTFAASPVPYSGMSSEYKNSVYYQRLMAVSLGENQIENLINVAKSQIGYTEGSNSSELAGINSTGAMNNYTEYGKRLSKNGLAWCCAFVNWCIYMAGIPGDVMPNRHAGCSNFVQSLVYNYGGTFHSSDSDYKPQAGDIIFYEGTERTFDSNGIPKISGHVGIVYEDYNPSTKKFGVIEGNGPGYVQANYQPLFRKGYTAGANYILGYVTPAYTTGTESQQGLVVRLTTPTQTAYVNKQFVAERNACVVTQIYKTAGSNITHSGLILMYADGSLLKQHTEDIRGIVGKNTTVFHSWYDINKEVGVTLNPGTTYKYRFFAVVDGITFEGDTYTFTTSGPKNSFTVYFDANGGSVSPTSKTVYSGDVFGVLPDPVRDGYDFQGWYTSPTGGSKISANTNVNLSSDISLYAHWAEAQKDEDLTTANVNILSVSDPEFAAKHYVAETSACLITEIQKTPVYAVSEAGIYLMDAQGNLVKQGKNTFSGEYKDNASFYLWYDTKDHLGISLQPGTTYKYCFYAVVDGQTFEGETYTFTTTAPSSFTATFYSGLDYSNSYSIKVTKGQPYGTLPSPSVPDGYSFIGWFTAKVGGEQLTERTLFNGSEDISLYAHYDIIPEPVPSVYIISYSPNGGKGSMMTQSYSHGDTVTVSKNAFTNNGYSFQWWNLYRLDDGKYHTNNGWQSYEDIQSNNYKISIFDENTTWYLDELWTEGCENAREFSFIAIWEEKSPEPFVNPFTDVKTTDYFYDSVLWAVENGITSGLSASRFGPSSPCTRAQVVTFLWRAMGEPAPASSANPFSDVRPGDYYYDAVLWAVENGITNGLNATTFGSGQPCTRAQVATFLWRTLGKPAPSLGSNPFADVTDSAYYYDAVLWAVDNGVTTGLSASSFGPNAQCSRAQIVTFLYRALGK